MRSCWFGRVTLRGGGTEDGVGGSTAGFAAGGGIVVAFDDGGETVECAASGAEGEDAGAKLFGAGDASEELSGERRGACVEHAFDGLAVSFRDAADRVGLIEEVVEKICGELIERDLFIFGGVDWGGCGSGCRAHGRGSCAGCKKVGSYLWADMLEKAHKDVVVRAAKWHLSRAGKRRSKNCKKMDYEARD